jgi:hypothetical protein
MAGRGPAPKSPDERRKPRKETRKALPPVVEPLGPELVGDWPEQVVQWHATWRVAPQASQFVGTDWSRLQMLAPLVAAYFAGDLKLMSEIRLNESLLGATEVDRRRLRWDLPAKDEPAVQVAARPDELAAKRRTLMGA